MDEDDGSEPDEPLLIVSPLEVLVAALLAQPYVSATYGANEKDRLAAHRQKALDWLDWAVCNSDLGRELQEAKAQAATNRKRNGGGILPPPFGL